MRAVGRSGDGEGVAFDVRVIVAASTWPCASSSAVSTSSPATGASFTAVTVTETRPVSVLPRPSETVYSKESSPLQSASGVYMQLPAAEQETVPCAAAGASVVTLRASPSASESPTRTLTELEASSAVDSVSSSATGAMFSGVTVTLTVAVSLPPSPSEIEYWKESGPL